MNFLVCSCFIILLLNGLCCLNHPGPQNRQINFNLVLDDQPVQLGGKYFCSAIDDSISFEVIKCYISNVRFLQDEKVVKSIEPKHFLLDAEKAEPLAIEWNADEIPFNKVLFNIGVDSLTSVSGVFGGDLDPTKGMYWTWQSGYINFKLEGVANLCPARNNRFQFHIGGYQHPFNTLQQVQLNVPAGDVPSIKVELGAILKQIDLRKTYQIMSPSQEALEFAGLTSKMFSL